MVLVTASGRDTIGGLEGVTIVQVPAATEPVY
jgi:hypothetical protein